MRSNIAFHIPDRWSDWPDLTFGFVDKRSGFEIRVDFSSDSTKKQIKQQTNQTNQTSSSVGVTVWQYIYWQVMINFETRMQSQI